MKFRVWMTEVDIEIQRICGLSHDDLADTNYRDMFDGDTSPKESAHEVLQENGWGDFADTPDEVQSDRV